MSLQAYLYNKDAQKQISQFPSNSTSLQHQQKTLQQPDALVDQSPSAETSTPTLAYQHPSTANSVVRLSDNEISKILALPIGLVSDNPYSTDSTTVASGTPTSAKTSSTAAASTVSDSSIISSNNGDGHIAGRIGIDGKFNGSLLSSSDCERNRNGGDVGGVFFNHNNNNNNSKTTNFCDNSVEFLSSLQNVISMNKVCIESMPIDF